MSLKFEVFRSKNRYILRKCLKFEVFCLNFQKPSPLYQHEIPLHPISEFLTLFCFKVRLYFTNFFILFSGHWVGTIKKRIGKMSLAGYLVNIILSHRTKPIQNRSLVGVENLRFGNFCLGLPMWQFSEFKLMAGLWEAYYESHKAKEHFFWIKILQRVQGRVRKVSFLGSFEVFWQLLKLFWETLRFSDNFWSFSG